MKNRSRGRNLTMTRISTWTQAPSRRSMGMKKRRSKREEAMREAMKEKKNRTDKGK